MESSGIRALMSIVGRSSRTKFRDQVLNPLMADGLVKMSLPHKPQSPKQEYRLTNKGRAVLTAIDRGMKKA